MRKAYAKLVFDGKELLIPEEMGTPAYNQMKGSKYDQLCELAGRICYDSLGLNARGRSRGRSSEDFHAHIHEVGHTSIYRHANATFKINNTENSLEYLLYCIINRPGCWLQIKTEGNKTEINLTCNLCSVIEWDKWTNIKEIDKLNRNEITQTNDKLKKGLLATWAELAPLAIEPIKSKIGKKEDALSLANPTIKEEQWASLYLNCSRVASHEAVRHSRACPSQRSGRYCNDFETPFTWHPLIRKWLMFSKVKEEDFKNFIYSRGFNKETLKYLEDQIPTTSTKASKRKQARSAARYVTPHALQTKMLLSASAETWEHFIDMRASNHADAEIRELAVSAYQELKKSNISFAISDRTMERAEDGLGNILKR